MKCEVFIFEHDIQKYPPILSIIYFLLEQKKELHIIGSCPNQELIDDITKRGGSFYNIIDNDVSSNKLIKLTRLINFKRRSIKIISNINKNLINKVWLFGETSIWLFANLFDKYKCVAYLFEVPSLSVATRYKLLSPGIDYQKILQGADKVVCCEYNRAHITKSYFNLRDLPIIIPNKPFEVKLSDLSIDLPEQAKNKKIILYQGIFNYPERKMDELCDAMEYLSDDFVLCLMGSDNYYKDKLRDKYSNSNKIVFLPYVAAPNHLNITKLAYIGFLSYSAEIGNIVNSLNTLYCAPNKVFEYSMFSIPMLSNDIPALTSLFEKYDAGISTNLDIDNIVDAVREIDENYDKYSLGSKSFNNSVNLKKLYLKILE